MPVTSAEDVRKLALLLPGVEEGRHHGVADFRVQGRVFASLPTPGRAVLRVDQHELETLLEASPRTYEAEGLWGAMGWTVVRLEHADPVELGELLLDCWRRLATRAMFAEFEARQPA